MLPKNISVFALVLALVNISVSALVTKNMAKFN